MREPQIGAKPSIVHQRAQERRRTRETRESRNQDTLARVESPGQNKLKYHNSQETSKHRLSSLHHCALVENKDRTKEDGCSDDTSLPALLDLLQLLLRRPRQLLPHHPPHQEKPVYFL